MRLGIQRAAGWCKRKQGDFARVGNERI